MGSNATSKGLNIGNRLVGNITLSEKEFILFISDDIQSFLKMSPEIFLIEEILLNLQSPVLKYHLKYVLQLWKEPKPHETVFHGEYTDPKQPKFFSGSQIHTKG